MRVAVCIVGFRNPADILSCIAALSRSNYANFQVVICENGGSAAYQDLVKALPAACPPGEAVQAFAAPRNLGFAGGVNACIGRAPGVDAWWILNPDTVPEPEALSHLVSRLAEGGCEAVGGTLCFESGRVESRGGVWRPWLARAVAIDFGVAPEAPPSADIEQRLWYLSGASMLVSRRFVERVGEMREDYFLYGEEVEWFIRARKLGVSLGVSADAKVLHRQGATTGSVPDLRRRSKTSVYLDERNKLLLTRDHFRPRLPVVTVTAFLLLCLRFGKRRAWRQLGFAISGWWAGLLDERGAPRWLADTAVPAAVGEA